MHEGEAGSSVYVLKEVTDLFSLMFTTEKGLIHGRLHTSLPLIMIVQGGPLLFVNAFANGAKGKDMAGPSPF